MTVPRHVAIIMDGNGRWAKARGLPRTAGHKVGSETVKKALKYLRQKGVQVVTLFAFSSENWGRPQEEVDTLMGLFRRYLENDVNEIKKQGARLSFIGDRTRFPVDMAKRMTELEQETANNTDFHVVLALSYGARDDIIGAVKQIASDVQSGKVAVNDISADMFGSALSTAGIPAPDLVIRTSGEQRISNFLLWEIAYAEFYFTPVFWPDFDEVEIDKALADFAGRQRRYGKI